MEVDLVIERPELHASERSKKLLSLFGSCKNDAQDLDGYMAWSDQQRKQAITTRQGETS